MSLVFRNSQMVYLNIYKYKNNHRFIEIAPVRWAGKTTSVIAPLPLMCDGGSWFAGCFVFYVRSSGG